MKQSKALALLKSGKNVFLTGSAGSGKTYVLNQYISYLKEHEIPFAKTASTGIAATHLNGSTIHSWSGIGIKDQIKLAYLRSLKDKKFFKKKMDSVKVLIIDEISMLHHNKFELVNKVLQFFKQPHSAFGGIQVVFSGDFFQLPPIGSEGESAREKFAFMSQSWLDAQLTICNLTDQHRQQDNSLNRILNEIRENNWSMVSKELLKGRIGITPPPDTYCTHLFTHNTDVDAMNEKKLNQLNEKEYKFKAKTKGNPALIQTLKKSVLAKDILFLKKGAKVMFVKNNLEKNYCNGTMGKVIGFSSRGLPKVQLNRYETFEVKAESWSIDDEIGRSLAVFTQLPLRLAWAITIHKSQGMTLDAAQIDLSKTFEAGQGYVALSRLRDINGLYLLGINEKALEMDTLAIKANRRFCELSEKADNEHSLEKLEILYHPFIEYCGGSIKKRKTYSVSPKKTHSFSPKKTAKENTYKHTKRLIDEGMDINEICKTRELKRSTIINHITVIAERFPECDISHFKTDEQTIKKVKEVFFELKENERGEKKKIFEKLKGEFSYDKINLALIFAKKEISN